jgi:predicted nucleic acid-binding protein
VAFLLSTQAVADFISRKPTAVRKWAESQPAIEIVASVISIGAIAAELESGSVPAKDAASWKRYLADFEDKMHRSARLLTVDRDVVRKWALFRDSDLKDNGGALVGEDDKLIWATAVTHGLVLVDKPSAGTDSLAALGLQVYDPSSAE